MPLSGSLTAALSPSYPSVPDTVPVLSFLSLLNCRTSTCHDLALRAVLKALLNEMKKAPPDKLKK